MDMLEDYLRAVSRLLPKAQREDVIAELRDEILTRIEVQQDRLGRALTRDETEQLLRDVGHPIVVAARYRDEPQYGVGPNLYPYWSFFVRCVIILEVATSTLILFGRIIGGGDPAQALGQAIGAGITGTMTLIGFATVAAWIIERKAIKIDYFNNWTVRDLRFLDFAIWDWSDLGDMLSANRPGSNARPDNGKASDRRARFDRRLRHSSTGRGIATLVFGLVLSLWWAGLISFGLHPIPIDYDAFSLDPGRLATIDWPALKALLYWPVLAYFGMLVLFGIAILAWPSHARLRGAIDMTLGMTGMGLALWLWTDSSLAPALHLGSAPELFGRIEAFLAHPQPMPLELLAALVVLMSAIGAFFRTLNGLWTLLSGAPSHLYDI